MRDTDRLIEEAKDPPSRPESARSFSQLIPPAPSSFVSYEADAWLPTTRAVFSVLNNFVVVPLVGLTVFTFVLSAAANLYHHTPWWANLPPFAHTVLGGALSFLMVFRTNTAYSRWWEARLMWGQVTIGSRNIAAQTAAMMHAPARLELLGMLVAFPIALKSGLRDESTAPSELAGAEAIVAQAQDLRAPENWKSSAPALRPLCAAPSAPIILLEAMSNAARNGLKHDDGLATSSYLHLCEEFRSLTQAATACERIKATPMPLGYVSVLRAFLLLWLCTLPLTMVGTYGHAAVPAIAGISFLFLNLESTTIPALPGIQSPPPDHRAHA